MPDVLALLAALDAYRVDRDLSWRQLAVDMEAAGVIVPARTLHYLCKRVHHDATVRDRTLVKIQTFLKRKRIDPSKRRRRATAGSIPVRAAHA